MMKMFIFLACAVFAPMTALADDAKKSDKEYEEFLAESPFNKMYAKQVGPAAAEYFAEWNKMFSDGAIPTKEARLVAVSASAAMKCEYCITAQVHLAKKAGASDDEIKTAIQIAAEVARFSVLLYGNEFSKDELKKILKIEE